jgi:hypothetical protein
MLIGPASGGSKRMEKNLKDEIEKHDDYEGNAQQPHNDRGHLEELHLRSTGNGTSDSPSWFLTRSSHTIIPAFGYGPARVASSQ